MTDFTPRRDVQAISHLNVVVDDIEVATEFYCTVLGFEQAANADGPMDYPGVDLASFARDAGFDDGRVSLDVRFLKHPEVGVYLELFTYHHPKGDQTIHRRKTNDLGGIRHVAVEVPNAVAAYVFIPQRQLLCSEQNNKAEDSVRIGPRLETPQLAAAIVILGIAIARIVWFDFFASRADLVSLALMAVGLALLIIPLNTIKSFKAGGFELSLNAPHVQGAVASLNLDHIEDAKLRNGVRALSHLLPVITGSRLFWIDDKPEAIIGERRLLRALGVTIVPAVSSVQAREILRGDKDFDLIVSDVQRTGDTHELTGGEEIYEGVNFIVWLRTRSEDSFARTIPVIFYAAYDWSRLVKFTRPARETVPEPSISNSVADLIPKVILALAQS